MTASTDVFETYRVLETGALPEHPVIKVHVVTNIDRTVAAPGRDLVRIEVDMYHDPDLHDADFYAEYADRIEATLAGTLLPELRTSSVYRRIVTPIDYAEWFGHTEGRRRGAHTTSTTTWFGASARGRASRTFSSRANGGSTARDCRS